MDILDILLKPPQPFTGLFLDFWTHSRRVKGHLAFTYLNKNQSKGEAKSILHDLFWIFENLTLGLFTAPLSANFSDVEFIPVLLEQKVCKNIFLRPAFLVIKIWLVSKL